MMAAMIIAIQLPPLHLILLQQNMQQIAAMANTSSAAMAEWPWPYAWPSQWPRLITCAALHDCTADCMSLHDAAAVQAQLFNCAGATSGATAATWTATEHC